MKKTIKKILNINLIIALSFSSLFPFKANVHAEELIIGTILNETQYLRTRPTTDTLNNQKLVHFSTGDIITLLGTERTTPTSGCTTGFYKATYKGYTGYVCAAGVKIGNHDVYQRPWTSPKKSIVGGGIYISGSYIAQGQFTSYLKKYNVNPSTNNMYNHQYMANITAPSSESITTYNAYNKNGFLDLPFEFSLPIFNNMQEKYDRPGGNITTVERQDAITDPDFEEKIKAFPESYKPYLRRLHTLHPNWKFKALNTNEDFTFAVNTEKIVGAIQGPNGCYELNDDGSPVQFGNDKGWYYPNFEATAYYMDPRNFLTEKYIFQFESLEYSENHTESLVQSILNNTFMSGISILDNQSYASIFIEAGKTSNVSALYLASLARQESGTGGGAATTGNKFEYGGIEYSGLFNFYNIGAKSSASVPYKEGLKWASGGFCTLCANDTIYDKPLTLSANLEAIGIKNTNNFAKGFNVGESIASLKNKLQNKEIAINSTTDIISTGTTFNLKDENSTAVILGDLTGDGKINSADLLAMRKHLQGTAKLSGAYLEAAKLVNNNVNSADLLKLRQHLLGTNNIIQE